MAAALLLVAVLSCCAALASAAPTPLPFEYDCSFLGPQHNFTFGSFSPDDRLFFSITVESKDVPFLDFNCIDEPQGTISYIEVTDLRTDGTGGCAYVSEGGVGFQKVVVHLQTLKSTGFEFHIAVWGH